MVFTIKAPTNEFVQGPFKVITSSLGISPGDSKRYLWKDKAFIKENSYNSLKMFRSSKVEINLI